MNSPSDFGSSVGRYANRIGGGKLTVAGKTYQLPQNNFGHCLHGGPSGWIYQVYDAKQPNDSTLILTIVSPDGDNNFPGTVTAHTTYKVLSNNTLDITFDAMTDKETVVNMTNHSYFNLNGDPSKEGTNMWLYLNADNYTPADSTYMTTGEILPVEGTPMDFRKAHALSQTINDTSFEQIRNASGYDHNWCLNTCFTPAPSKEQIEAITFTTDYRKMIRSSWNVWDIVGTLLVVGLCGAFYWYFW